MKKYILIGLLLVVATIALAQTGIDRIIISQFEGKDIIFQTYPTAGSKNTEQARISDTGVLQINTITDKAGTGAPAFAQGIKTDTIVDEAGTGAPSFPNGIIKESISSIKFAAYTITDSDDLHTIFVTTGASDRDITLPVAGNNTHRIITVKKTDAASGKVVLKSAAAGETIDGVSGTTGIDLPSQFDSITVQCDGLDWFVIEMNITVFAKYRSSTNNNLTSGQVIVFETQDEDTHSAYNGSGVYTVPIDGVYCVTASSLDASFGGPNSARMVIAKNGTDVDFGDLVPAATTGSYTIHVASCAKYAATNTIQIEVIHNETAWNVHTDARYTWLSIHRVNGAM